MFLLDTDVLSLTSPASRLKEPRADAWRDFVRDNGDRLWFSVITIMEVRFGIERSRLRGATRQAAQLSKWLLVAETIHADRLVAVSPAIAHRAGEMLAKAVAGGASPSAEDALIAASAENRGMRLISRNRRHMLAFGIECIDPLAELPR